MAVDGEMNCPLKNIQSVNDGEENGAFGLDLISNGDTNSTRPGSVAGSHGQRAPSTSQSLSSVSLEERLKRMRAAEELKQQQRYAAFIESQRQADLVRMRAQEERKRKIEELRQREEARRSLVLERRRGLEQSNKARIESLRERSRAREESVQNPRRRVTEPTMGFGRTASASPSLGSARNPNQLMTTSCVVAFGSSAPRSILSGRSNSSQDCNKLGRPPRVPGGSVSSQPEIKKSSIPNSTSSCNSSTVGSVRSISVDTLPRPTESTHVASVFDRLSANTKSRTKVTQPVDNSAKAATKPRPAPPQIKKTTTTAAPRSTSNSRPANTFAKPIPKGMSQSVYADRKCPPETKSSVAARKRSASPPPTLLTPNSAQLPQPSVEPAPPEHEPLPTLTQEETELPVPNPLEPVESPSKSESSVPTVTHTGPIKAETHGSGEGAVLNDNEAAIYRAKLVEQRRLAKERKEEEQRRLEEENRQRRLQQEAARLAAEQAAREQAELAAREAAESQRQREEEEKARLEAAETERLAKLQRAEEERIMRKKKLDSIMSRVKQTQSGASATASSPALQTQQQDELISTPSVRGDVSDSQLYEHTITCATNGEDMVVSHSANTLVLESDRLVDVKEQGSDVDSAPTTDTQINKPNSVSFSLCTELDNDALIDIPQELDAAGDHTSSSFPHSEIDPVQSKSHSPPHPAHDALHSEKLLDGSERSPGAGSPEQNRTVPQVVRQSQSNGDLQTGMLFSETTETQNSTVSVVSAATTEAPRFKSALLQSMLGGGRLATRAKDAVAGLRQGSVTQLGDIQSSTSHEGSGSHSPVYWTQGTTAMETNHADDFISSRFQTGSRESLKYNSGYGAASMVRSMFDGSADRYHINGSSDAVKPNGSTIYAWQASPDCDLAAPESMSPRPVHTSTN